MAGETSNTRTLDRFTKGDTGRTAMHADVMNEIVDSINRIFALEVTPKGAGRFIWSDANGVLQIDTSGCGSQEPPSSGTFVCGSVDGVKQWLSTQECACTELDGGSA